MTQVSTEQYLSNHSSIILPTENMNSFGLDKPNAQFFRQQFFSTSDFSEYTLHDFVYATSSLKSGYQKNKFGFESPW